MVVNKVEQKNDIQDPVEQMLKKTGCIELHYQVQECIFETQDWRKCQDHLQKFRICMEKYNQRNNSKTEISN